MEPGERLAHSLSLVNQRPMDTPHPKTTSPVNFSAQSTKNYPLGLRLRMGERRILLIIGDLIMAALSLAFGVYFWASAEAQQLPLFEFLQERLEPWFFLLPIMWLVLLVELYDHHKASDLRRTFRGIALAALIGIGLYMLVFFISTPGSLPRRGVAGFVLAATILTLLWRMFYIRVFTLPQFMRRAVLVGAGVTGQALLKVFNALPQPPFSLAALLDDDPNLVGEVIEGYKVIGGCEHLAEIIEHENASDVIVAISGKIEDNTFSTLLEAQERGAEITRMPSAYEEVLGRVPVHYLEADWILRSFVDEARTSNFYFLAKRIVDILGGLVGVAILALIGPFHFYSHLIGNRPSYRLYPDAFWPRRASLSHHEIPYHAPGR